MRAGIRRGERLAPVPDQAWAGWFTEMAISAG
jgi:hypothetical protein